MKCGIRKIAVKGKKIITTQQLNGIKITTQQLGIKENNNNTTAWY